MIVELINDNNDFRPFFEDGQTNHLPMTLFAMFSLGASNTEISSFITRYLGSHKMEKLRPVSNIVSQSNWRVFLGQRDRFEDYQHFFANEIKLNGVNATIGEYFNQMIPGIASEAYHCLIELCYAIESKNEKEVINSLAYLSACYFDIPDIQKDATDKNLTSIIQVIEGSVWFNQKKYDGHTISEKIISVFADPEFSTHFDLPNFNSVSVHQQLRNIVLKTHLVKWNFISLHLVTSFHTLKTIEPFVTNKSFLYKMYWTSFIGCLLAMNQDADLNQSIEVPSAFSWDEIFIKAIRTHDEHTMKLVYSCFLDYSNNYDLLYEAIASKATH